MGVDKKNPAGEGGASGDANEPSGEGRTLGNLRATPIGKGHRGRRSVHEQVSAQFGGGEGPAKRGEGRGRVQARSWAAPKWGCRLTVVPDPD